MLRIRLRAIAERPFRTLVTVAMVAVCSALVVSVAGLVTSVSGTADRVAAQVAGTADLEVAPAFSGGTVPDGAVDDVAAVPGVAAAAPTVQSAVTVDATRALLVAGDARALPFLPPGLADAYAETAGTPPAEAGGEDTGPGPAVLVSVALADDAGLAAGDTVAVRGLTGVTDARVAGVLPEEVAGATVVADLTTGERLRGGGDGPDRLLLALDGDAAGAGGGERAVARRVDEVLAGRAVALDPARRGDAAAETLQPLLRPLLLLSGLTVTVAAVLVFNVVSLAVAERRRYLAIQCALGARRRRLWLGLVGEAALLGAVGGVIGAAVGRPLTAALIDQVPPALASAAVSTSIATDVRWWVLLGGVGVGVAAAAVAAAAAGLPVVRLSPLEAMGPRDVVGEPAGPVRPLAVAVGAVAVIAGVVIVAVAPATLQLLAALVILNGVVALVWALRVPIARVVAAAARRAGPPGLLAALALERSPARNAATVLGSLLPVAAVVSIGGLQVNVYDTALDAFASLGDADLYVSAQPFDEVGIGPLLPAGLADEVRGQDGVTSVGRSRFAIVPIGGQDTLVQGLDPGSAAPVLAAASPRARTAVEDGTGVVVTRALADRLDLEAGDNLALPAATGAATVEVADVVDVFGWAGGVLAATFDDVAAWAGTDAVTLLEVDGTAEGVAAARTVVAAAGERDGVRYQLTDGADAVDGALTAVRQSQALLSALQGVLMASGAFAIVTTLVISTVGRTRELGLLRAVGARRRLVRRAVVVEAFAVTLAGAGAGVVLGTVFQFVAVRLAATAAGFPAEFALTPGPSLTAAGAGLAIAAVGAFAALRRALRLDVLDAVAYE